jgi:hypothetical protein
MTKNKFKKEKTKIHLGIVDEIHRIWNMNRKIVGFFIMTMFTTLYIAYRMLLMYPEIDDNLFWSLMGLIFLINVISGWGLLVKSHGVITDVIITKVRDDAISARNIAESHMQWVAAKPDQLEAALDSFRNNDIWVSSNAVVGIIDQLKAARKKVQEQRSYIKNLEAKKKK